MNKRQRKKHHLGEFQELVVELSFQPKAGVDPDAFWEKFIYGIEARKLGFSGMSSPTLWDGVINSARGNGLKPDEIESLRLYLSQLPEIESYKISDPKDAWYGEW